MMIISILLSCAIIVSYYYIFHLTRVRRLINLIPGPMMVPIIGDIIFIQSARENLWNLLVQRFKKYYPIYKSWIFTIPTVSISHPNDVQTIMKNTKCSTKGKLYKFLHPWLRDGLLVSKGTKWQERRKILTPAFHFNILKKFFEIMLEESNQMTKSLKNMKDSTVNLESFISYHTLNIISESAMGISLRNTDVFEQQQYRKAIHDMGEIIIYRLQRQYFSDILFRMSPKYKKQVKSLKILHDFTDKIIAKRKQYHKSTDGRYLNSENNVNEITGNRKKRIAMLDLLLMESNNNQMSDLDIREEVDTFMFEGHDTVTSAISFAILMLAKHKNVQNRVRNEVNTAMENNEGKLTMTTLQNLPYLERCLQETLRLNPSVFFITRTTEEDILLQSYVIPSGTEVHIDIYNIHRNPEFWPNPEIFDPDRFLPEQVQNRHPFAFVPFSAGLRNCIGKRFAMMELKTTIGILVHNFYLEPVDISEDMRFQVDLILRPLHPLRIKFIPIQQQQLLKTNMNSA